MYGDNILVHVLGAQLPLTLSVERAARLVGIGRSSMYAAIKRGDISVMRLNGRTVVLTVPLLERMGLELDTAEQSDPRPSADWHGK
jgi:excisionase family DNA binding protein